MKKLFSLLLCLLLMPVCAAAAPENGYIARISSVQLYSASEDAMPRFITIDDLETAEFYLEMGLIDYFEINQPVHLLGEVLWQQTAVNLPAAWEKGASGSGVIVGVIDSGIYPHTDFEDNIMPGYNILTGTTDTTDNLGHGTRVSGRIAAAANGFGTIGAAPAASIMPLKTFDAGVDTYTDDIVDAIEKGVQEGCHILNMSLGFDVHVQAVYDAVVAAQAHNVLVVAAAGNNGTTAYSYPAAYPDVIGVGAVTSSNEKASYSQYNSSVDIAAPGNCYGTTNNDGGYMNEEAENVDVEDFYGTSFAAPIISGILALGLAYKPSLSPDIVADALLESVQDLGMPGRDDYFGYGLADAAAFIYELDKSNETRLYQAPGGVTVYSTSEDLQLYGAIYSDSVKRKLLSFASIPIEKGYNRFSIPVTANTSFFLFDGLRPVTKALEK